MTTDLFCIMQFNDAEKLKLPVEFINPQQISQPNLVMKLRINDPKIKRKRNKEKARIIKEMIKSLRLQMSTYIGRAILQTQYKDYIMAPYNFK